MRKKLLGYLAIALFLSLPIKNMAHAAGVSLNMPSLITIRNLDPKSDEFDKLCMLLQTEVTKWSLGTQPMPECQTRELLFAPVRSLPLGTGTIVQVTDEPQHNRYLISIKNLATSDTLEPKQVSWHAKKTPETSNVLRSLLRNYAKYDVNIDEYKKNLVSNYLGYRVDDENFNEAYRTFVHDPDQERYVAAGLEIAAFLTGSIIGYYGSANGKSSNSRDWDYPTVKDSLKNKLSLNALRFDDNKYPTNEAHIQAGAGYTILARTSGADRAHALLFAAASSTFWETAGEYREVISIVDEFNTILGGFVMGEVVFQMSKIFIKSGPDTAPRRFLRSIFEAPERVSAFLEGNIYRSRPSYRDMGFIVDEENFWSHLDFYAGLSKVNGVDARNVGFRGEVINIPYYESPGKVSRKYLSEDTVDTTVDINYANGPGVGKFMRAYGKIVLSAIYQKNLALDAKERLEGYQLFFGPSMGYEMNDTYLNNERRTGASDYMSVVHVIGGTADYTIYKDGLVIRGTIDTFADFAMMHSPSFDLATGGKYIGIPYTQSNCDTIQSVLCHEGYYYGWGGTQKAKIVVQKDNLTVGGSASVSDETMINGRSRFLETAKNIDANDVVSMFKGWVAYSITDSLSVEVGIEKDLHKSKISGPTIPAGQATRDTVMKYGRIVYRFD